MSKGIIRYLIDDRGFGFVSNSAGKDIFFHYSELDGAGSRILKEGQNVSYRVALSTKGLVTPNLTSSIFFQCLLDE